MDFLKLIQEGRVDDFKAKYSQKFGGENVNKIVKSIPHKYLDWVGKNLDMINFDEDLTKVSKALEYFNKISSNLPITDLYQYKSVEQLLSALSEYANKQRRVVKKVEGGNVVYDDGRFFVVNPLTHDSSCYYGRGTKWCTAASSDYQFKRYNEDGKLFYILDRNAPSDDKFYKVALLQKFDGDKTYYDAQDETVNKGWILGTNELNKILSSVEEYMESQYPEQIKIFKDKELARKERERLEQVRQAQIIRQRESEAQVRRANGEWDLPDADELGLKAHALLKFLIDEGSVEVITNQDRGEIARLENEIERLQNEYENGNTDLADEIEDLENELEEYQEKIDVYNIIPIGRYYDASEFDVIGLPYLEDRRYIVGDDDEMRSSAYQNLEELLDDIGIEGFNENFVRQHIDEDAVISYAEDLFNQDVYDSPESYLNDFDRNLSKEQEERKQILLDRIEMTRSLIKRYENELSGDDDDEAIQNKIEEMEEQVTEMEEEIQEIEEDPEGDFPDELLEDIIQQRVDDVKYDILGFMNEWGLELRYYIDKDSLINDIIDSDGYGHVLNGYDGSADEIDVEGETFYVMRID